METVEMRCPVERQRMFGKMQRLTNGRIVSGNLLEFACDRCRKSNGGRYVFHRFNLMGELVETEVVS